MATYGYDPNVDYAKGIQEAVANQDWRTASVLEQQRNEKIRGMGLENKYPTTSHYAAYLPKTEEISAGMDRLANAPGWEYDQSKDPAMQAYRKQYLREADRGTRDVLGSYAAQTGGVASTAAVGAAQQAGNYYRSQLADKVPELMNQDYSRYLQGREADRADLSLLASLEAQREADSLGKQQWAWQKEGDLWQRNFQEQQAAISAAMSRWETLGYADQGVADVLGVPVGTSTQDAKYRDWQMQQSELQAERDQEYREWQMQQSEQQAAISQAMNRWATLGYADQGVADVLGVQVGTSTSDAAYRQWQQQQSELSAASDREYRSWQMQSSDQNSAYTRAMSWIQMGIMPSDADLAAAGIDKAQAQRAVYLYQQAGAGSSGGSASGGTRSSGGSGSGSGSGSDSGSGKRERERGNDDNSGGSGKGVSETVYKGIRETIYRAKQAGNRQAALNAMDKYIDTLSDQQYEDLKRYMDQLFGTGGGSSTNNASAWSTIGSAITKPGQYAQYLAGKIRSAVPGLQ